MKKFKYKIEVNAPVTIAFVVLCVLAYGLSVITKGSFDKLLFSVSGSKMSDFLTYPRFLGPMLEEKYET